ncbi:MAG TPA: SNF2-related protein [Polyangiaceae bacterium]|nr:SNF2-related protein [Polyangiaceae bacterium]
MIKASSTKDEQVVALARKSKASLAQLLRAFERDELKHACREHGLGDSGRSRSQLAQRIMGAAGVAPESAVPSSVPQFRLSPEKGDIVLVRQRQYLVTEVIAPASQGVMTVVRLVCLDDDAQGRTLEVLWELELGARILQADSHLGAIELLDEPREFAAYFHAVKWNRVTATDGRLFQAPFRAGIALKAYQLTPLRKALELPRANLFIADDVGLGKTIEAGLVVQELLLRQRIDWVLIVCPAAVTQQWKGELERRFGLSFEIYNRDFVTRRRQERGFQVNPWTTHNRFIVSYQTFRRPEYRDPLLHSLDARRHKSLLVLDEAHTAAPATATKYARDTKTTRAIQDLSGRFENRLFLSATPHNGHSNSFSALLEMLDPQRFLRGSVVSGPEQLAPVMVRRLKSDLIALGIGGFPTRRLVQLDLVHEKSEWLARPVREDGSGEVIRLGKGAPVELELSTLLARYTALACPAKGRGRFVFINLQKRLLSSVEAFTRTLEKHAASVGLSLRSQAAAEDFDPVEDSDDSEDGVARPSRGSRATRRVWVTSGKRPALTHPASPPTK